MHETMDVGIVTVGNELLAGHTVNTNATWLCAQLHDRGVRVSRVIVVPDQIDDIAAVVEEQRAANDAVVVTGGVGPTHDDVTMEAVSLALDRQLVENDEAKTWLTETGGYVATDLVDGTADLPEGATPIHNEVGVAPGAKIDTVYVFPGVPAEMKAMFATVEADFSGRPRYRRTVVIDEPESHLLDRFDSIRDRFDIDIGSYPGEVVRVTLTGTDESEVARACEWLRDHANTVDSAEYPDPSRDSVEP